MSFNNFLVVGLTGAGKTVRAKQIAEVEDVILVDEVRTVKDIDSIVKLNTEGNGVVATLHAEDDIDRIDKRLFIMSEGRLTTNDFNVILHVTKKWGSDNNKYNYTLLKNERNH